jgi:hypothetical protein
VWFDVETWSWIHFFLKFDCVCSCY